MAYQTMMVSGSWPIQVMEKDKLTATLLPPNRSISLWTSHNPLVAHLIYAVNHMQKKQDGEVSSLRSILKSNNNQMLITHHDNQELSLEQSLHVGLLSMDNQDMPLRVLSFFEQRVELFADKSMQAFILSFLCHHNVTEMFKVNPLFIEKLKQQVLRCYAHYVECLDIQTASFCVHYLKRVEGRYLEIHPKYQGFTHIDYKELFKELSQLATNDIDRQVLDIAKGVSHYPEALLNREFQPEWACDILRAQLFVNLHRIQFKTNTSNWVYHDELDFLQMKYRQEIAHCLREGSGVERILGDRIPGTWHGQYPDYQSDDGVWSYNVVRSELTSQNKKINFLQEISQEQLATYGMNTDAPIDHARMYYNKDRNKRISLDCDLNIVCEYQIDNIWVTYQQDTSPVWNRLGLLNIQGYYAHDDHDWALILADAYGNPMYTASLDEEDKSIKYITKTFENIDYFLVPQEIAQHDLGIKTLKFLEQGSVQRLTLWQIKNTSRKLLEIDNGALSFIQTDQCYMSVQYPGFYLASCTETSLFGFVDYIHLIHRESKKEKVVIVNVQHPGDRGESVHQWFNQSLMLDGGMKVFNLDEGGNLVIASSKDFGFIAQLCLIAGNYARAWFYLSQSEEMGMLDESSQKILMQIIDSSDNHPDAVVCKMQALYLLKSHLVLYGRFQAKESLSQELFLHTQPLYQMYLATYGKSQLHPLLDDKEKILWTYLSKEFLDQYIKAPLLKRQKQHIDNVAGEPITQIKHTRKRFFPTPEQLQELARKAFINIDEFIPEKIEDVSRPMPFLGAGVLFRKRFIEMYNEIVKRGSGIYGMARNRPVLMAQLCIMECETDEINRYLAYILQMRLVDVGYESDDNFSAIEKGDLIKELNRAIQRDRQPPATLDPFSRNGTISTVNPDSRADIIKQYYTKALFDIQKFAFTLTKQTRSQQDVLLVDIPRFIAEFRIEEDARRRKIDSYGIVQKPLEEIVLSLEKKSLFNKIFTEGNVPSIEKYKKLEVLSMVSKRR
jgi:hypothetical protein